MARLSRRALCFQLLQLLSNCRARLEPLQVSLRHEARKLDRERWIRQVGSVDMLVRITCLQGARSHTHTHTRAREHISTSCDMNEPRLALSLTTLVRTIGFAACVSQITWSSGLKALVGKCSMVRRGITPLSVSSNGCNGECQRTPSNMAAACFSDTLKSEPGSLPEAALLGALEIGRAHV